MLTLEIRNGHLGYWIFQGNTWKDECSALREANTKLASRLECLELSTISSLEGSDQNDE